MGRRMDRGKHWLAHMVGCLTWFWRWVRGMATLTIDPPPGVVKDGTDTLAAGRWRDANLVRWREGVMQPVGGWTAYTTTAISGVTIKSAFQWRATTSTTVYTVLGTGEELYYVVYGANNGIDITPSGLTTGDAYDLWIFDNWGSELIALLESDGRIFRWGLGYAGPPPASPSILSGAPTDCLGVLVTPERFLFALGAGGNFRKVQWCDREDLTTWTPAATNEAGDFELETTGKLVAGLVVDRETMLLTTADAWVAQYLGPPFVYGFQRVGSDCGLIAPQAAVNTTAGAVWMGNDNFYAYDGAVREIPCPVRSYVFDELDREDTKHCIFAVHNPKFSEVWWFFPSSGSTTNDRYVTYNYREDHWMTGSLSRTAGVSGSGDSPVVLIDGATSHAHDVADGSRDGETVFAETGPIFTDGESNFSITKLIPDEKTQGQVQITFKTRHFPNGTEYTHGPYDPSNPTSVRFTGRQMRMRVTENVADADWRIGPQRLVYSARGAR